MDYLFGDSLRDRIAGHMAGFSWREVVDEEAALRRAAVALVVVGPKGGGVGGGEASLLLTKRPKTLRRHSGQYALPGGRMEEGETTTEAALRELHEELGLELGAADVLGRLDDFPTRSGFRITPVIAWGGASPTLKPDPGEVARVFHIPLGELDSPDIPHLEHTTQSEHPVLSAPLPVLGHSIFAPTAALLYQFREVALRGEATRVAHYDQPAFAWK